jgi:hypothetical protein
VDVWEHVGAARDVQGAGPVMFQKPRSQIACGIPHSACDHWFLTVSGKFSFSIPASLLVEAEERLKEKLSVAIANARR